jgi:hypothetical protein
LDRVREILGLLGHGDTDDRGGDGLGLGLATDLCEKSLADLWITGVDLVRVAGTSIELQFLVRLSACENLWHSEDSLHAL